MFDDIRLLDDALLSEPAPARPPRVEANMRRLRALVEVAQCQSVNRAAERLHVTQSAVTRGVRALEDEVGVPFFKRSSRGMILTEYGELLVRRTCRAITYLETAEAELTAMMADSPVRTTRRGVAAKLTQRHLQALSATADFHTETAAAKHLGISQPAVTTALRDLEEMVGTPMFLRSARGMLPTPAGELLIRGAKLALSEIVAASDDLAARLGMVGGRLVVGAMPLHGSPLAPQAVNQVASQFPHLRISMVEASHEVLLKGLRCGDIDIMVGGLTPLAPAETTQEQLFDDRFVVVVRNGHPLSKRRVITLDDLAGVEWVLPYRRTTHRNTVERAIHELGLRVPERCIEANSVNLVRSLLMSSDRLSVLSMRNACIDAQQQALTVLPIELPSHRLPVGYLTRSDSIRTVGVETLIAHLRGAASQIAL